LFVGFSPGSAAALPGWSNAALSSSLSARSNLCPGALRQPHVTQPAAEQPALPARRGSTPSDPSRVVNQRGVDASPSSVQRSSWCQESSAGERSERIRARHRERNSGPGAASASDPARETTASGNRRVRVGLPARE